MLLRRVRQCAPRCGGGRVAMSRGALLRGTASKNATACLATTASGGDDPVVSPQWLSSRLSEVKVLDATWYLPKFNKDGRDDFGSARIPGARYFDIDAIADKSADLKHMLPPPGAFAAAAEVGRPRLAVFRSLPCSCADPARIVGRVPVPSLSL